MTVNLVEKGQKTDSRCAIDESQGQGRGSARGGSSDIGIHQGF